MNIKEFNHLLGTIKKVYNKNLATVDTTIEDKETHLQEKIKLFDEKNQKETAVIRERLKKSIESKPKKTNRIVSNENKLAFNW